MGIFQEYLRSRAAVIALGAIPTLLAPSAQAADPPVARPQFRAGPNLQARIRESTAPAPTPAGPAVTGKSLRATLTPDSVPPPSLVEAVSVKAEAARVPGEIPTEVFPAQFLDVTPGETTKDELRATLGRPLQEFAGSGNLIWAYRIGPFPRVEIRLENDLVQSIRVQFGEPRSRQNVFADLELGDYEIALLTDERGEVRGEIIPERGLQLTWSRSGDPPEITQILLDIPRGANFVRRAQQDPWQRYQRMLSDLSAAKRLEPQSAEGLAVEARIRQRLGQPMSALELASAAALLDVESTDYRLLRASLLSDNGRHAEAFQLVDQVVSDQRVAAEWRAYARALRGELLLASPTGRPELALEHFQRAIADAGQLARAESSHTRRLARDVLMVSYLGGAAAIAQGKWQNRAATVDKWWSSARALSRDAAIDEQAGSLERWDVLRRRLQLASLAGGRIPGPEIIALRDDARHLAERAGDPLLASRLDWDMAEALLHAAELAQANRLWPEAREYAEEGLELAKSAAPSREVGFATDYLQGRLTFLLGAYHAVVSKDADQVKHWLGQAGEQFASQHPLPLVEQIRHGERLVFMGQTYAEQGDPDEAASWLARGIDLLEPLARQGIVARERAVIPLEQLAAIRQAQGKKEASAELTARAAKIKKGP